MVIGKESRLEWQKFILKKITKRIPLVSSLACKKLRGTVSSLQQKKAKLNIKNSSYIYQRIRVDITGETTGDRKAETENHNLLEQNRGSRTHCWRQHWVRKM